MAVNIEQRPIIELPGIAGHVGELLKTPVSAMHTLGAAVQGVQEVYDAMGRKFSKDLETNAATIISRLYKNGSVSSRDKQEILHIVKTSNDIFAHGRTARRIKESHEEIVRKRDRAIVVFQGGSH